MKKYWRWILFAIIAIVLIAAWIALSANKGLRQKIEGLLLERFVRNKVEDLKEQAVAAETKAKAGEIDAAEAEEIKKKLEETGATVELQ